MVEKGNRKFTSFIWIVIATLCILVSYFIACVASNNAVDSNVIIVALAVIGGDGIAFKGANAIGDHQALKRGATPDA